MPKQSKPSNAAVNLVVGLALLAGIGGAILFYGLPLLAEVSKLLD